MKTYILPLYLAALSGSVFAATEIGYRFTLNTTDADGAPIQESRTYLVYRPDNLSKSTPVPLVVVLDNSTSNFRRLADKYGFVVAGCTFNGNSTGDPGTSWNNDNPRISGWEDFDYLDEVIRRVRASENTSDTFTTGLSKDGHMSMAYATERPNMLKAAATLDEFMQLTLNIPSAPLPIIAFHGTLDTNVPYTMLRDTVDQWRAVDELRNAVPVTTFESSPLQPGKVSQATWRGGVGGTQVALVTIIGGSHTFPLPTVQTGYDYTDTAWAFFSQFLTVTQPEPRIVSQPVNNVQLTGQPASFWVVANGNAPFRYQWQKDGTDIPGANSNWYTLPASTAGDDGAVFRAIVSNDSGAVTSSGATLTVKKPDGPAPAITTQPADQSVLAGQSVTFTVAGGGSGALRYQWTKNGVNIAGATGASYTIPAAITADCGASFAAIVTSGNSSATSVRATLTVLPAPGAPIVLANPVRWRALVNDLAHYSVTAWSNTPMTYQWQKGGGTANMADIPGATASTYTTAPVTLADSSTLYRCVISNAYGSVTTASEMLLVTTDPRAPTQLNSTITAAAQAGAPFQYTILSSGGTDPIRYIASPLPPGLTVDTATGVISGTPTAVGTTQIQIAASNDGGTFSRTLTLTVGDTTPLVSIEAWRAANFGASAVDPTIAGDDADPDGDGVSNINEFRFGSNPLDPKSVPPPGIADPSVRVHGRRR
jgi:poly(3-hydroxybutyrate) depolymerase